MGEGRGLSNRHESTGDVRVTPRREKGGRVEGKPSQKGGGGVWKGEGRFGKGFKLYNTTNNTLLI